jgi:hypothetical protein
MASQEGALYEAGREENFEALADVDSLVPYRSLAAVDRGDSYRIFWECLAKKISCPIWPGMEGCFRQNQRLQADFCRIVGLTPLGSYDTLATRVAGFEPQNAELSPVPYCFSSECRSATQRWKSQSWIRPKYYLRRTTIDDP